MRIVVVGPQYLDSLAKDVLTAFKDMGYESYSVDEDELLLSGQLPGRFRATGKFGLGAIENLLIKKFPRFEKYVYKRLCRIIEALEPDLVVICNPGKIPPHTISNLKQRAEAAVVCWFPDHPGNLGRGYVLAGDYDALFFKDKYLVQLTRDRLGKNAFYLPECCQPKWHRKVKLSESEERFFGCDLTIAGNLYWYRALIFEQFLDEYEVKLWGPPVPKWLQSPVHRVHQNRYVGELEKAKAFNAAKIVLNTFQPGEFQGVNVRTFEAAGCGAFQICEFRPEIEEVFIPGKEIVVFHSLDDLREKIDYYLAHPEERRSIADAGYERAHREHTYEKRLRTMLDIVAQVK
jgi:spore maturation protein CgeB